MDKDAIILAVKGAVGVLLGILVGLHPIVQLLLVSMVLDIFTGVLAAYIGRTICSSASFRGMAKKALTLLLVWGAWWAGHQLGQPLGEAVAGFYALTEWISIVENASDAGLPVPQFLKDALKKLSAEEPKPPEVRPT